MKLATAAAVCLAAAAAGCGASRPGPRAAPDAPSGQGPAPSPGAPLELRSLPGRPALLILPREGDPRGALAAVVAVDAGPIASVALAALVEARLSAAGLGGVVTAADRDGYRVGLLVAHAADLGRAALALHAAMTTPLGEEPLARKLIAARVGALRAGRVDAEAPGVIARCTAELVLTASEAANERLDGVEAWRAGAHGAATIALAVVGDEALTQAAGNVVAKLPEWPSSTQAARALPPAWSGVYVERGRRRGTARLSVAIRVAERGAALALAGSAGQAGSALAARLAALPVPFRMRRVATTLDASGACVLVEMDAEPMAGAVDASAATAAALVAREVGAAPAVDDGAEVARRVRSLGDPREAAAAAARWALSRPGSGPPVPYVALGVGENALRSSESVEVASQRFAAVVAKALALPSPPIEERLRAEPGQGEAWVLVGSPCAVIEDTGEAGLSALAMLRAAREGDGHDGVALEPWVAADGAGLIAHAVPRVGEDAAAAIARVSAVAARALYGAPPGESSFVAARGALLARLDEGGERARDPLASAIAPGFASQLAPWGLFDAVARGGALSVDLRRDAIVQGPARVAVISPASAGDGAIAARVIGRWLPAREGAGRCSASPTGLLATGLVRAPAGSSRGRAWVALAVDAGGGAASAAAVTALALAGDGGLLERSLEASSVRASAFLLGASARAVLIVELSGEEARLEAAAAQVRALLARLGRGAASAADLERAAARYVAADVTVHLDPRRRLIDLFRGAPSAPAPDLGAWRAWLAASLRDDHVAVVLPSVAKEGR